jgi:hypothetical protein
MRINRHHWFRAFDQLRLVFIAAALVGCFAQGRAQHRFVDAELLRNPWPIPNVETDSGFSAYGSRKFSAHLPFRRGQRSICCARSDNPHKVELLSAS